MNYAWRYYELNITYDHKFDNVTRYAYFIIKIIILDTAGILFKLKFNLLFHYVYIKNKYLKEYFLIIYDKRISLKL